MISVTRLQILLAIAAGMIIFSTARSEVSPHWTTEGCRACHSDPAPVAGAANLKVDDAEALCESCHGTKGDAISCRHSSGIAVGGVQIAESLQPFVKEGEVVCSTCHDIVFQCEKPKAHFSLQNRGFLRDRTSHYSKEYCYKCHAEADYAKLNPHLGTSGSPPKATCLLCHQSIPAANDTGSIDVAFNMQHDLNDTCLGCHNVRPHPKRMVLFLKEDNPDEWLHLVAPSEKVLARMRAVESEYGIVLPLNPINGEIFCGTCHDQHGFESGAEQPEHRLRANPICQACHEK